MPDKVLEVWGPGRFWKRFVERHRSTKNRHTLFVPTDGLETGTWSGRIFVSGIAVFNRPGIINHIPFRAVRGRYE